MSKVCIVTGGSAGIGQACVQKFAKHDYQVFNLDLQGTDSGHHIACDVTDPEQVEAAINLIYRQRGRVDSLVCNAGVHFSGNLEQTSEQELDRVFDINVKGIYYALKVVLPIMREAKKGNIVLLGSDQSSVAKPNSFAYNLSKFAVASMTKTTALDYAKYNICVNAVCPGTIDTPLLHNALDRYCERTGIDKQQAYQEEIDAQVLPRIGTAEEVADLVYFLGRENTRFITGSLHNIDGGYTAR